MRIKICGITRLEDATIAVKLNAWALGFNFSPQSPRKIAVSDAAAIAKTIPSHVEKVGVFVNASKTDIFTTTVAAGLTLSQLHGDETPEFCEELGLPFIKVFRPKRSEELSVIEGYAQLKNLKAIMIDASVAGQYGGTGHQADYALALKMKSFGVPLILAGGLKPENVAQAIAIVKPYAVDVASGVELSPGIKDETLLREFMKKGEASES